ncbi:hypothetical protein BC831DRAFT_184234 [Entophlyctis helioformis]|nr:hypothetical protein BC831DRAFT_184234 [Entophlyctis helioformis]
MGFHSAMKLRARPGAVGGPADTLDVSSRTASACGWLHGDTLVVLPSSVPQPRTPPSAAGPAPAAAQAACKPCVLRVVFDSDDDTSDNDSTSSSPFVGIPRWLFNWWTRGDVLGWAAADPSSTDLQVECKVLRSSATPGVAREPATADQPDPPAAVQSSSAGQSSSVVCLARISTTPWTPTSHGIRSSTSDLAAASKAVDPRDDALVKSAQDWSANVRSHLAGRLICTDTLVMLPRNSRPAVFLVAGISRSSPSEPSAGPAEASVITQVDFDDSCQLEFLPALALAPTYHHASILTYPLAAYNQHAKELQAILEASLHRRSLHEMLGIAPSRAMYVAGPRGVGKESLIMHAVCSLVKCPLVYVHLSEELQSLRRGGSKTSALTPLYKAIWKAM